jgi:hypothetical protein
MARGETVASLRGTKWLIHTFESLSSSIALTPLMSPTSANNKTRDIYPGETD